MKQIKWLLTLLAASILISAIAIFINRSNVKFQHELINIDKTEAILAEKYDYLEQTIQAIGHEESLNDLILALRKEKPNLIKEDLGIFVYEKNKLVFWTDRDCPLSSRKAMKDSIDFQRLSNGYYILTESNIGDIKIIGSILVKKEYNYRNPFIPAYFSKDLNIPSDLIISTQTKAGIPIKLKDKAIFSISKSKTDFENKNKLILSNFLFGIAFILFILSCLVAYDYFAKRVKYPSLLLLPLIADLAILRWLMYKLNFPSSWHNMELFSPRLFAENMFNNSLGDFLLNGILLLALGIMFHKHFSIRRDLPKNSIYQIVLRLAVSATSLVVIFYSLNRIDSLINNSSIPLNFNLILSLDIYSFIGLLIAIIYLSFSILIADKLILSIKNIKQKNRLYLSIFILTTLSYIVSLIWGEDQTNPLIYLAVLAICYLIIWFRYKKKENSSNYFTGLSLVLLISFLLTVFFNLKLQKKEYQQKQVMAMNLSNERDAGAEYFMKELNAELCNDTLIPKLLKQGKYEQADEHFKNEYLKGYLESYDFQLSLCTCEDSLLIQPENYNVKCHEFFFTIIDEYGIIIPGTDFFFLDDKNGQISYLGQIKLSVADSLDTHVFVELNSRTQVEGPGYPELLLDKSVMPKEYNKHLSYAKYNKEFLISSSGKYDYPHTFNFDTSNQEYCTTDKNQWRHLIYRPNPSTQIVVSQELKSFNDYFIFFTYIFFLLFMLLNIGSLIIFGVNYKAKQNVSKSFKNRIQSYFVVIVSLSIIIIGTISIIFYIQRYREKQKDTIQDKMQSVQIELTHKLGEELVLNEEISDYMNYLLVKFSNVFYTDINLFALDGSLLASSREEVYDQGLVGKRMDPVAYHKLSEEKSGYFVQNESIGEMNYLSAYIPFKNNQNELLAYINLPYFAKQNEFSQEISSLTVALINVYLILFLATILIAIFVSNSLTKPLRMIQDSIRSMDIRQRSQKIEYQSKDELGSLINEYNRKIDELQESAQRLAQSERESAWREMAKQIAHEIKNPLTPMKLSVQHLSKAYKDNDPDLDFMFEKVSRTLVEQIDSLSHIATEFSNFAKIRVSNLTQVDLVERILSASELYDGLSKTEIIFERDNLQEAIILADKEQVLRVFNNLIKNAVQAIPKDKLGQIIIQIKEKSDIFLVSIQDNGKGIPKELKDRIFSPNFTTKSSGMGLGLSIVKGIIGNLNGNIYYKTKADIGTTFFIEFPKFDKKAEK